MNTGRLAGRGRLLLAGRIGPKMGPKIGPKTGLRFFMSIELTPSSDDGLALEQRPRPLQLQLHLGLAREVPAQTSLL